MALTVTSVLNEAKDANASSYTTSGSVSFVSGRWYIACVVVRKISLPSAPSSVSSTSNTFTLENSGGLLVDPNAGQDANMSLWHVKAGTTETATITVSGSDSWTGMTIHVFEIQGGHDTDIIEGSVATNAGRSGTSVTATLDAFSGPGDRPMAFVHTDSSTAITFESGWTQIGSQVSTTAPVGRSGVAWHSSSQDTSISATVANDGWGVIAAKLQAGPETVSPGLIDHSSAVFAPQGDLGLLFGLVDHSSTVFAPQVDLGLMVSLVDQSAVVFAPTVASDAAAVSPGLIDHLAAVFSPGIVSTTAVSLLDHSGTVFSPSVSMTVSPGLIDHSAAVFDLFSTQTVSPGLVDHGAVVFAPRVDLAVFVSLLDYTSTVFAPEVDGGETGGQQGRAPLIWF